MTRLAVLFAYALLPSCSPAPQNAEDFAQAPKSAAKVVAICDAGRARRDCIAARQGLAEADRRKRITAYARAFEEP